MDGDDAALPAATDADLVDVVTAAAEDGDTRSISRALLRTAGPRLLRDTLGPTISFYTGWKTTGSLLVGVAFGMTFAFAAYGYERRHGRPGMIARLVLVFVVLQAVIGLATGSATAYLVQPSILGAINGTAWLGSVAIGRPLAAVFASEVFPLDEETRASDEFRAVFRHVSLVFGSFFLAFAAVQLVVLLAVGIDAFVAVRILDAICILSLIVYAVHYTVDHLGEPLRLAS
jgi:hypothetical protein